MARVGASIHRLTDQENRLIRLYGMGHVTEDYLSIEAGLVRKARADKEAELSRLRQRREHISDLDGLADRVKTFYAKVAGRLRTSDWATDKMAI